MDGLDSAAVPDWLVVNVAEAQALSNERCGTLVRLQPRDSRVPEIAVTWPLSA